MSILVEYNFKFIPELVPKIFTGTLHILTNLNINLPLLNYIYWKNTVTSNIKYFITSFDPFFIYIEDEPVECLVLDVIFLSRFCNKIIKSLFQV